MLSIGYVMIKKTHGGRFHPIGSTMTYPAVTNV